MPRNWLVRFCVLCVFFFVVWVKAMVSTSLPGNVRTVWYSLFNTRAVVTFPDRVVLLIGIFVMYAH